MAYKKKVFANPEEPIICPVLSLAVHEVCLVAWPSASLAGLQRVSLSGGKTTGLSISVSQRKISQGVQSSLQCRKGISGQ